MSQLLSLQSDPYNLFIFPIMLDEFTIFIIHDYNIYVIILLIYLMHYQRQKKQQYVPPLGHSPPSYK